MSDPAEMSDAELLTALGQSSAPSDVGSLSNEQLLSQLGYAQQAASEAQRNSVLGLSGSPELRDTGGTSAMGVLENIGRPLSWVTEGLSQGLPFSDEIKAAGATLGDKTIKPGLDWITSFFGGPQIAPQGSWSDVYNAELGRMRDKEKVYELANPVAGKVLPIAGGAVVPVPTQGKLAMESAPGWLAALRNVGRGSTIGAGYGGLYGFSEGEGDLQNRIHEGGKGAATGALVGAGLTAAGEGVQGAARRMPEEGLAFNRKALGTRQSDYQQSAESVAALQPAQGVSLESHTKAVLNDLIQSGSLGSSVDPATLLGTIRSKTADLGKQVNTLIVDYEKNGGAPVFPQWDATLKFLQEGKAGDRTEKFLAKLADLEQLINQDGKGSLSYLQQQKIAKGSEWDLKDGLVNDFNRMLYADMQRAIEDAVPGVAPLNEEMGKLFTVEPIVKRSLSALENRTMLDKAGKAIAGGSGYAAPAYIGSMLGGPLGTLVGAAGAGLVHAATTPTGRQVIGNTLRRAGPILQKVTGGITSGLTPGVIGVSSTPSVDRQAAETADPYTDQQTRSQTGNQQLSVQQGEPTPKNGSRQSSSVPRIERFPDPTPTAQPTLQKTSASGGEDLGAFAALTAGTDPIEAALGGGNMVADVPAVPPALVQAVIQAESSGNPAAVSPKGAQGLMQIMPATFAEEAAKLGIQNPDPMNREHNQAVGTAYLSQLIERYNGNIALALSAYNWGLGRVDKIAAALGTDATPAEIARHVPAETQAYMAKILARYNPDVGQV